MQARYQYGRLDLRERKKGPHVWQWRWYDENGKRKSVLVGTIEGLPNKAAAERAVESLRIQINSEVPQARFQSITVSGLLDRYLTEVMPNEVRRQTQKSYRSYSKYIRTRWGTEKLHSIDNPLAIEAWLKTIPLGTAPHVRNFFHLVYQWAIRWKLAERNPIALVRQSRKRSKIPRVLRPEEFQALLKELTDPYKTMVQVCCGLGLRACELLALQWGDFDWHAQTVLIQRSVVQGEINPTKTEASQKSVPLGRELVESLLRLKSRTFYHTETDYVFAGDNGKTRWQGILLADHIKPAAVRAGIGKIGWHTLRHMQAGRNALRRWLFLCSHFL